jgi:hypothetical protein
MNMTKTCCKKECTRQNPQSIENFHKNKCAKDGLNSECKTCKNARETIYRNENRLILRIRSKKQRDKNPDYHNNWVKNNKEDHAIIQKRSKDKNREEIRKKSLKYYYKNREHELAKAKKRRDENPEKERAKGRRFRQNNPGKVNVKTARRRTAKLQRTPIWLTGDQLSQIENYYIQASYLTEETGINCEVDHILPLQGKNVSGLHIPSNLQILSRTLNIKKGNRILEENSELYKECEEFKKKILSGLLKNKNCPFT